MAVIAFDAASTSSTHTCTGTNLILIFNVQQQGNPKAISSVTYNSVAMTAMAAQSYSNGRSDTFYLLNPSTGSNTISVNYTGGSPDSARFASASYTGVKQSGQPDATNGAADSGAPSGVTASNTSVADRCWTILAIGVQGDGVHNASLSASTGATSRASGSGTDGASGIFDSNSQKTPAGAVSISVTFFAGRNGYNVFSLAPAVVSATLTATVGSFVLTGIAATLNHARTFVAAVGSFIMTGRVATLTKAAPKWTSQSKNTGSWTSQNKS